MLKFTAYFVIQLVVILQDAHGIVDTESSCVYMFNVPASQCSIAPVSNPDVPLLKSLALGLQSQMKQLSREVTELREQLAAIKKERCSYKTLANPRQFESLAFPGNIYECEDGLKFVDLDGICECVRVGNPSSGGGRKDLTGGVVYVRWGRKTCPGNATLLYSGTAGGSYYPNTGGGTNYQCLPQNPQWGHHTGGHKSGAYMSGAEYEFPDANSPFLKTNFAGDLDDNNVPCALCHVTERHAKMMIPAWKRCPEGWTREYNGYLTTSKYTRRRTTFECMDEAPEVTEGGASNRNGAQFFTVEAHCAYSLPCPNYVDGWALTCVVCTK